MLQPQAQSCLAAGRGGSVFERESAAVGFGDLAAQDQADAGAAGFRGEEGHKQVVGVGEAWAVVLDDDVDVAAGSSPMDVDAAAGFE